jgi:hypothetical protein
MRDSIRGCYGAERFLLLDNTMYHFRPVFSGNTVVRVFWPRSSMLDKRGVASVKEFNLRQRVLHFEIQFPRRGKEEIENW